MAFARILPPKPKVVFLDEASSALDEGLEFAVYDLVRTELPDTILVSVSHRPTVDRYHDQRLELLGEGEWRIGRVLDDDPRLCRSRLTESRGLAARWLGCA